MKDFCGRTQKRARFESHGNGQARGGGQLSDGDATSGTISDHISSKAIPSEKLPVGIYGQLCDWLTWNLAGTWRSGSAYALH
jgi:hypothetical protein